MKMFIVRRREVHAQSVKIEAISPADAIQRVANGEGEDIENALEYADTLDPATWDVSELEFE